jgi:release factor glutamine methyltransferase
LDGGEDGLDFYRKIIRGAGDHLISGGRLALEVGQGQTEEVSTWLQAAGYDNIQRFNDHLQVQRVVMAQRHF